MSKANNLTGQRFGRLTAVERAGKDKHQKALWRCSCDCGGTLITRASNLKSGATSSCGCLHKPHGGHGTRLYRIWKGMKDRCRRCSHSSYECYGGRGISVCEEWNQSFETFREWALANGYRDGLTIDRVEVDGNYCPENCRWVTMKEQGNNRRNTLRILYNGETHTIAEWSKITGIKYSTIYMRLYNGWSVKEALATE